MIGARPLADGVTALGSFPVWMYLFQAEQAALVDTGMSFHGPALVAALREQLEGKALDWIVLTHSHFDHVGNVSALRQTWPHCRVVAHPIVADVMQKPRAIELIAQLNDDLTRQIHGAVTDPYRFEPFHVDVQTIDGCTIDLGGLTLQCLDTPGHTRDSISIYCAQRSIAVTGEACGVPRVYGGVMPEFLVDYDMYMHSLLRVRALDLDIVGTPHVDVVVGRQAVESFFAQSVDQTQTYRDMLLETYDRMNGDRAQLEEFVYEEDYVKQASGQPPMAYRLNLRAMLDASLRWREQNRAHSRNTSVLPS